MGGFAWGGTRSGVSFGDAFDRLGSSNAEANLRAGAFPPLGLLLSNPSGACIILRFLAEEESCGRDNIQRRMQSQYCRRYLTRSASAVRECSDIAPVRTSYGDVRLYEGE